MLETEHLKRTICSQIFTENQGDPLQAPNTKHGFMNSYRTLQGNNQVNSSPRIQGDKLLIALLLWV